MQHFKFAGAITLTIVALISLSTTLIGLMHHHPEITSILLIQAINTLGCYILLGLGLGLPLVVLATIFGWVQLVLLASGNINPHLVREDFFKVLKTLFSKL